ncbi:MAG: IclR family transcriptional regulator [Leucobacter sp.]
MSKAEARATTGSQTLSRGLQALELLADAQAPLSINELAEGLGIHRSNAYRILRSLEERRFVVRDESGRIKLGPKISALARGVAPALHTAATPAITELAYALGMTAFFTVLDGDEVVTLVTVEPSNATAIARNPGVRHPVDRGAPGHAMEASLTALERERFLGSSDFSSAAIEAQQQGYSVSRNEVVDGVMAVAVPLRIPGEPPAAVAITHFLLPDPLSDTVAALQRAARQIAQDYS